jgi:mono/diheme cytochrome c family protein
MLNRYTRACLLLLIIAFAQCTQPQKKHFNPAALQSQYFTINLSKDTVLHTAKGALINIPAGSIKAAGNTIQLEIKEAYSIYDMIISGLTTVSNGKPLSSGGMIYINPTDKTAEIIKPINISIPTTYKKLGMQVFKGSFDADSNINWIDPKPLSQPAVDSYLAKGKAMFQANCAACHRIDREVVGAPLAYAKDRFKWDWLVQFTQNSSKLIASGDQLANCRYETYGRIQMTAFPQFSDSDLHMLYDYIEEASQIVDPATMQNFIGWQDSCRTYNDLLNRLMAKRDSFVMDNGDLVEVELAPKGTPISYHIYQGPSNAVVIQTANSVYYKIDVQTWGWENIDVFMKDRPGFEMSKLTASVNNSGTKNFDIYLAIPSEKVLVPGGLLKDKASDYGFYANDATLPLPQNKPAYIIVMGDNDSGGLYLGISQFTTSHEQNLSVNIAVVNKHEFDEKIKTLDLGTMNVNVDKSKNADSIRSIDKQIQLLQPFKPKLDCNCGLKTDTEQVTDVKVDY